ncbi:type III pantothenate kinase [Croceitalea sp. MTPC5]|uniref:type III pantothenate kinase n=1 Tax=Croceitalea sp. MTPC5 TaxID=3056565 RepID=UPI002B3C4A7E|nr:type III pantothenate kinase [Croceitalea sp. MTPC5]
MNLVVDIGNTLVKYAVYDKNRLVVGHSCECNFFLSMVKEIFEVYPKIEHALIASVKNLENKEYEVLSLFCKVHLLSHNSNIPFVNKYATPESLGIDRIALVTAAFYNYPKTNVLVIDAGTCVTYDFINEKKEYFGGAISPGMMMRYKAMNNLTAKLPLLSPESTDGFIGDSTESCMHIGVINGLVQELEGVINQYRERFKFLTVILTGGDAHFFAKRLKNSIFANSKFLLEGLNYLLEYNKS